MPQAPLKIIDVISDPTFIELVKKELHTIIYKRNSRPVLGKGFYYKRDWYDILSEKNQLNHQFFIDHISDIWHKKSNLNAKTRGLILFVCNRALDKYLKIRATRVNINPTNHE